MEKGVIFYHKHDGKEPFVEWLEQLGDKVLTNSIKTRVDRVRQGNYGDHIRFRGIIELRLHFGKGYRIYCGEEGNEVVILLIGGTIMNKRKYRTWDEYQIEHYTKHPKELKGYLSAALEEYQKDGDEKAFLFALSIATRVHGGFSKLSKATGLNRENLYRALSPRSDPRLSTLMQVLSTLGFSLTIR